MSSRRLVSGVTLGVIVSSLFTLGAGCLTRPVAPGNPVTKTNFTVGYNTTTIDKIDILFDIDNSSSMGDKQNYLQAAVPDLITRLVSPNCVDAMGNPITANGVQLVADSTGACTMGTAEFPPVHDMHIGVVTSSLGPRGTTSICQTSTTPGATPSYYNEYTSGSYLTYVSDSANNQFPGLNSISKNNDDQAHLINRTDPPSAPNGTPSPLPSGNFLAWVPPGSMDTAPPNGSGTVESVAANLTGDFQSLVIGSQAYGCGIESQLETWYRFLIQPDPYASIATTTKNQLLYASWDGLDSTILQQRADFLRPDSLVLIVVLTDEDDSEIDVRTIGGVGVNYLDNNFQPPLGTTACAQSPGSSACTSCAFGTANNDPNCMMNPAVYTSSAAPNWGFNDNLRHVHMKEKYGVDLQYPINRYVVGLTQPKVPNRSGEYPNGASYYQGGLNNDPQDLNCDNPLFSSKLPTSGTGPTDPNICTLSPNTVRTPGANLVYYAHIGGVPNELLTQTVNGVLQPKETLAASDWQSILGMDPETYNYSGIDPHMIESYQPRTGLPVAGSGATVQGDEAPDWYTDGAPSTTFPQRVNLPVDREYACVFPLATPRNCDPNNANNSEADISSCDCSTAGPGGMAPTLPADHVPSVCNAQNPLQQDYAKAYPTIRELLLAEKLGTQGIVSSLCPIHVTDNSAGNDPLYGYRPAVASIIDRLKTSLTTTCLPETLTETEAGAVPCLVLVTMTNEMGQQNSYCTSNATYPSLTVVDPTVLMEFKNDQAAAYAQSGGTDLSQYTTCQINQVLPSGFNGGTCKNNSNGAPQGWCYITGGATCPQSLVFSTNGLPNGGVVSLQCLENSSAFASGNGTGGASSTASTSSSGGAAASGSSSGVTATGTSDAAAEE